MFFKTGHCQEKINPNKEILIAKMAIVYELLNNTNRTQISIRSDWHELINIINSTEENIRIKPVFNKEDLKIFRVIFSQNLPHSKQVFYFAISAHKNNEPVYHFLSDRNIIEFINSTVVNKNLSLQHFRELISLVNNIFNGQQTHYLSENNKDQFKLIIKNFKVQNFDAFSKSTEQQYFYTTFCMQKLGDSIIYKSIFASYDGVKFKYENELLYKLPEYISKETP